MNNDFTAVFRIESAIDKYVRNIRAMNKTTAYGISLQITRSTAKMVLKMFNDVLSNYIHYLQSISNVSANVAGLNGGNIITCHSSVRED